MDGTARGISLQLSASGSRAGVVRARMLAVSSPPLLRRRFITGLRVDNVGLEPVVSSIPWHGAGVVAGLESAHRRFGRPRSGGAGPRAARGGGAGAGGAVLREPRRHR